jgi:hypothetical protein
LAARAWSGKPLEARPLSLPIIAAMSPFLLVAAVLVVLMALRLVEIYAGEDYVCPSCGARNDGGHSPECPWSRFPSG